MRIQLTLMAYNTCTCTNVLWHVRDLFKLIPNAFNVRQRVTSPLFHTSSYYLKDWIEQVAWLGIYQYNNTCFACSYTEVRWRSTY